MKKPLQTIGQIDIYAIFNQSFKTRVIKSLLA